MNTHETPTLWPIALIAALTIVLAACGQAVDHAELPVDDTGDAPSSAGACLVEEPDCDDTGALVDAGGLPPASDGDIDSSGMPADGGLSVSEARAADVAGVIAVQGFLIDDGTGPRLCDALTESVPPGCGGDSMQVTGHVELVDVPMINEDDVTWSDQPVRLLGELVDGVLVVDPTVAG